MTSDQPADREWAFPNLATPVGSPAYYAIRFSADATRELGARLIAWFDLIERMTTNPQDPGVVRLKLDWWREELSSVGRGTARHPLARDLLEHDLDADSIATMHRMLDAADHELRSGQPVSTEEFARRCEQAGGGLFELLCATEPRVDHSRERCMLAGTYWIALERVRLAGQAPLRVPAWALGPQASATSTQPAVSQLIPAAPAEAWSADRGVPEIGRRLTATAQAMHHKLIAQGFPIADKLVDRAPIAHLWTAWRCR